MNEQVILDLCAGTGSWSKPYLDAGYDVRVADLPEDVRFFQQTEKVHGILAAPPCTVFASSGARWPRSREELLEGISIMDACLRIIFICQPVWWALENPVGKMAHYLGKPKMYFQPWEYGDPYTKRTCLWGQFTKPIKRECIPVDGGKIHHMPPSKERTKLRSITPPGFAQAFFEANP